MIPLDVESFPKRIVKGKNNTQLKINKYRVLIRDSFKCVKCGNTRNLTIDHIHSPFIGNRTNPNLWKLEECQTMCLECHKEKNKRYKIQNVYYKN